MTAALLYQPRQRWSVGVAFGAAVLIHFAAIALANAHRDAKPEEPSGYDFPEIIFEPVPQVDEQPADLDDVAPTPTPTEESSFPEERPTPPPVRRQTVKSITRIVKPTHGTPSSLSISSARVLAVSAPRPEYPYEARRAKVTGNGIAVMVVDPVNGVVTDVTMSESTGSPVLDNAAIAGFRRWRFKPGSASQVKVPITFTMAGAMY
jgi:TonB family protein